ncbi:MAG TPA: cytochrome P450 [Rhizobiales bacterium]|nr:cytochrome P450 [Hyphomicrobiales bacterium]
MSTAPPFDIDMTAFWRDPYPALREMRAGAPICNVAGLGGTVFAARDDIFVCEKNIEVFSSHQPDGLMNKLMGHNLMRKDGPPHARERKAIFPTVSPKTVRDHWSHLFARRTDEILDQLQPTGKADLCKDYALPVSGEALKVITGLTNVSFTNMDDWSQAMIDGIANYTGDAGVEASCYEATAHIDAAIDDMVPVLTKSPDHSLLAVMLAAGLPMDSIRANIKLAISGGQNEPRDVIAGASWALLKHRDQLQKVCKGEITWKQVFEEYCRWISPIGMTPRRIDRDFSYKGIDFFRDDKVFFMFSSANRDENHFDKGDRFDLCRDISKSIAFGAGPHFCAGAWAARALVGEVALPKLFERMENLRLVDETVFGGWAFRGPLAVRVEWD